MGRITIAALLALGVALAAPSFAAAQTAEPTVEARAEAQRVFDDGLRAARERRWEEALRSFEAAYALVAQPAVLVNVATAQAELGRLVEARATYRRLLELHRTTPLAPDVLSAAERGAAEIERRLGRIRVRVEGATDETTLSIDGASSDATTEVWVAPGSHELRLVHEGETVARQTLRVAAGDVAEIELRLRGREAAVVVTAPTPAETARAGSGEPDPRTAPDDGARDDGDEGGSIIASPWLWLVVGLVVAGGAAVALTFALMPPGEVNGTAGMIEVL